MSQNLPHLLHVYMERDGSFAFDLQCPYLGQSKDRPCLYLEEVMTHDPEACAAEEEGDDGCDSGWPGGWAPRPELCWAREAETEVWFEDWPDKTQIGGPVPVRVDQEGYDEEAVVVLKPWKQPLSTD